MVDDSLSASANVAELDLSDVTEFALSVICGLSCCIYQDTQRM